MKPHAIAAIFPPDVPQTGSDMKANLTDRYIRNINLPTEGRLEISDTKRSGLRLRVSAKGGYVWMYEKRVKGGPKRKHTLGNWPAPTLAEARQTALEIEVEARRANDLRRLKLLGKRSRIKR